MIDDPELQAQVARRAVDEGLSVRETGAAIRDLLEKKRREEQ
jgi:ParB-like chromosome segregation protein Spo0J